MSQLLETNAQGRPVLTVQRAKTLAFEGFAGTWYIAPFATQWTVGLLSADDRQQHHVLDAAGEPLRFEYEWDAWEYLRQELKVPRWKMPPSPRKQLGQSIGMFPSLVDLLIERSTHFASSTGRKRK